MDLTPVKKQYLENALQKGRTRILVVPQVAGVILPDFLMTNPTVPIDLVRSERRAPIKLLDDRIETDLSFNKSWMTIQIPWLAVGMINDCEGNWQAYDNPELNDAASQSEVPERSLTDLGGGEEHEITPPKRGHLKLVS